MPSSKVSPMLPVDTNMRTAPKKGKRYQPLASRLPPENINHNQIAEQKSTDDVLRVAAPQRMGSKITHKQSSHMNELVCNNQNVDRKKIENEQKMELSETAMVHFSQTDNPRPKDNNSF